MSQFSQALSQTRTLNTLAREGITAARATAVAGSTFGQPGVRKTNDQQRFGTNENASTQGRLSRPNSALDGGDSKFPIATNYLPRTQWMPLGDGWFQTTAEGSGSSARCGLHSLIESSPSELFMCVYEPRTAEAFQACTALLPEFDLEVNAKLVLSRLPGSKSDSRSCFQILFGFKSPRNYLALTLNPSLKCWSISKIREDGEFVICSISDGDIKPNIFYSILVQIRGSSVSIDINGVPVFTSIRITDSESLSGLVGLVAKCAKFAVKGWKIRGVGMSSGRSTTSGSSASVWHAFLPSPSRSTERNNEEDQLMIDADVPLTARDKLLSRGSEMLTAGAAFVPKFGDLDSDGVDNLAANYRNLYEASEGASDAVSVSSLGSATVGSSRNIPSNSRPSSGASVRSTNSNLPTKSSYRSLAEALSSVAQGSGASYSSSLGAARPSSGVSLRRPASASGSQLTGSRSPSGADAGPHQHHQQHRQQRPMSSHVFPMTSSSSMSSGSSVVSASSSRLAMREGTSLVYDTQSGLDTRMIRARLGPAVVPTGGGGPGAPVTRAWEAQSNGDSPTTTPTRGPGLALADRDRTKLECSRKLIERHEPVVVDMVMRDVVQQNLGVTFDDIAALTVAKRLLHEAVLLPLLMPEFFTGIREPWKGVLLFGPPGTGKTLLAKAVCGFNSSTFFSCSSSSLISKFRGESEKIVRCLFEAARICAPSVVFLDEVDALVCARGMDGEHEASRRLKTEFFAQMDGVTVGAASPSSGNGGVMVLATTNCPWDLDEAMRRRLEKRIHIPLPGQEARKEHFRICLRDLPISSDVDVDTLSVLSEGYSGADIHVACREASMMPMRRLISLMDPMEIQDMRRKGQLTIPKVTMTDFSDAIANTRPSVSKKMVERYSAWEKEFGSY